LFAFHFWGADPLLWRATSWACQAAKEAAILVPSIHIDTGWAALFAARVDADWK
jgi:hypothetical protein